MADKYHQEAGRTLRNLKLWTDHIPDGEKNARNGYKSGRADIIFAGQGWMHGAVEVKTGKGANAQRWPFANWSEEQRAWAKAWTEQGSGYWLFITVGTRIQDAPTKSTPYPRLTVLVPYQAMLEAEFQLKRESLPYRWFLESDFRLEWAGNQMWRIPENHQFWHHYKEVLDDIRRRHLRAS